MTALHTKSIVNFLASVRLSLVTCPERSLQAGFCYKIAICHNDSWRSMRHIVNAFSPDIVPSCNPLDTHFVSHFHHEVQHTDSWAVLQNILEKRLTAERLRNFRVELIRLQAWVRMWLQRSYYKRLKKAIVYAPDS